MVNVGVSHPQNEPCRYPDVSKSLWCSTCGGRQNDHLKGCPVQRGTSTLPVCQRCEGEGHTQENCTAIRIPCYKCGEMGHLADKCTQMGRFGLRHQIYDPPSQETRSYCYHCKEEGHSTENCAHVSKESGRKMREIDIKKPIKNYSRGTLSFLWMKQRQNIPLKIKDR